MRFIKFIISLFWPKMPFNIVYMLQQVDYSPSQFLVWIGRFPNIINIMQRKKLILTKKALFLVSITYFYWVSTIFILLGLILVPNNFPKAFIALILFSPIISVLLLLITIVVARLLFVQPRENKLIQRSRENFTNHSGIRIAIAGSYGKTTMKEILSTVLSEQFKVGTTEGNMNTAIAHARFALKLEGDEDVLIIEFGEGAPGDVARFAKTTSPDYAIITGLAPNHLDKYKTLDALASDLFSLRRYVNSKKLFIAGESKLIQTYIQENDELFTMRGVNGWKITDINIKNDGISFKMHKNDASLIINSSLIGRHQIPPLALAVSLAHKLGVSKEQIERGIEKIEPFEHRMKPRLLSGALIIDDTYNGNLEGCLAGIELLNELTAKRKIYVTPGLVEQGKEKVAVHLAIGEALIKANPDIIVLMKNTATEIIKKYLNKNHFKGQIKTEDDPAGFYRNLDHFVASGDLVIMQNDWTDNYS